MFFFEWNLLKYGGYSKHVSMFNSGGDVGCGSFIAAISGKFELVCGSGFGAISFFKGGIYREPRFSHHIWWCHLLSSFNVPFISRRDAWRNRSCYDSTSWENSWMITVSCQWFSWPTDRTKGWDRMGWDTVSKTMGFVFSKYGTKWETQLPWPELPIKSHPSTSTFITMFLRKSHKID